MKDRGAGRNASQKAIGAEGAYRDESEETDDFLIVHIDRKGGACCVAAMRGLPTTVPKSAQLCVSRANGGI
jgi:hypothetical protein